VLALLVELAPLLCERARSTAAKLGLTGVEVRTGDAGVTGVTGVTGVMCGCLARV